MRAQAAGAEAKAADLTSQAQAARAALEAPTPSVKVTDVVPLSSHDSRGTGPPSPASPSPWAA